MFVRKITLDDWVQVVMWDGFPVISRDFFPDDTFGCFDSNGELLVIVGRIMCGSKVAFLEGFTARPGYSVGKYSKYLIDWVSENSKLLGIIQLISYSTSPAHTRLYRQYGFNPSLDGLTQIQRVL